MNATIQQAVELLNNFTENEQDFALTLLRQLSEPRAHNIVYRFAETEIELKKFTGTSDLKRLQIDNFVVYPRETLYER